MKTTIQVFLLLCGIVLASATLAPRPPIIEPGGPGPFIFECPTRTSPFSFSTARLVGTTCVIVCNYENGSRTGVIKPAPLRICEATDSGAIYN
jgi:hypothetical protein